MGTTLTKQRKNRLIDNAAPEFDSFYVATKVYAHDPIHVRHPKTCRTYLHPGGVPPKVLGFCLKKQNSSP